MSNHTVVRNKHSLPKPWCPCAYILNYLIYYKHNCFISVILAPQQIRGVCHCIQQHVDRIYSYLPFMSEHGAGVCLSGVVSLKFLFQHFYLAYGDCVYIMKPSVSELIYIHMSLEVLFVRQHQALAETVVSLGQRKLSRAHCYLLNDAHKLGSSEQRKLQVISIALGGSGIFVDAMCCVLFLSYFSLYFSFPDFDVTFL